MIPKQTEYKVGMYLRLSNEDERAGESLSIENQRKILSNYISEQGWTLYDEYVDDGISGTTFDRPGVQRMLDDAKNGKINLILCKDLSRFGRNYIQVGQYTDYIFPMYNIRFIALTDNVDTANSESTGMDMMPIMNAFFEEYDFSGKKIYLFNTSGGSGFAGAVNEVKKLEPNANVVENGLSVYWTSVGSSKEDILSISIRHIARGGIIELQKKHHVVKEHMKMKKTVIFLMALCLTASFTACSSTENEDHISQESISVTEESTNDNADSVLETTESSQNAEETNDTESSEYADSGENEETSSRILVAYFTYAENAELSDNADASASASIQPWNGRLTGNTGVVADMIAQQTGGELFSIRTVKTYPSDYDGTIEKGQEEKNNNEYPELASHIENLDGYDTIFVGFPNWWYGMPMAMYSFFEEYDFSGKTIIPFCTSGGSGFSDALGIIAEYEPEATVLDWGYSCPMAIYSFLEEYDFSGKTVIPFCTHGTGGLADTVSDITDSLPEDCTVLKPIGVYRSDISDCYDVIAEWLSELGMYHKNNRNIIKK